MWIALTLLCALTLALSDALVKKALHRGAGHLAAGWLRVCYSAIPLVVVFTLMERPEIKPPFYWAVGLALPFEALALNLHTRALKASPMSLSVPFLAFTPAFVIFVAWVIVGERISLMGSAGIALMIIGGYVLNLRHISSGWLGPVKAIGKQKGALMMLAVAAIYSITATLIKVGINNSSAMYFGCVYFLMFPIFYLPFGIRGVRKVPADAMRLLMGAGLFQFVMVVTHVLAVSQIQVAYMVSIKRTSLIFGVILGGLIFREKHIRQRLAGALIMLAGFAVVAIFAQATN